MSFNRPYAYGNYKGDTMFDCCRSQETLIGRLMSIVMLHNFFLDKYMTY